MAQATIETTVAGIQGIPVSATPPTVNQTLVFNGTNWVPSTAFLPLAGGTVTGAVDFSAGTVAAPGIVVGSPATQKGFYATGTALGVAINGASIGTFTAAGFNLTGQTVVNLSGGSLPAVNGTPPLWVAPVVNSGTFPVLIDQWNNASAIVFRYANGTPASPASPATDVFLGGIGMLGWNGASYGGSAGASQIGIQFWSIETWNTAAQGSQISFNTTPIGTNTPLTQMWLNGQGCNWGVPLVIQAATPAFNSGSQAISVNLGGVTPFGLSISNVGQDANSLLTVAGVVTWKFGCYAAGGSLVFAYSTDGVTYTNQGWFNPGTTGGFNFKSGNGANIMGFGWSGTAVQYNIDNTGWVSLPPSDARMKRNLAPSTVDALSVINEVPVKEFDWIDTYLAHCSKVGGNKAKHVPLGIVANDVQKLIPDMVSVTQKGIQPEGSVFPDEMLSINLEAAVPYIIRALQQLLGRVKALEGNPINHAPGGA